jgi:molybdopterin synthase sulfur carrier subunit
MTENPKITIRYFAWLREKAGRDEEQVQLPADVATVTDLIAWLQGRDEQMAEAFASPETVRCAIDLEHVSHDAKIAQASEIAFFPPVTGG